RSISSRSAGFKLSAGSFGGMRSILCNCLLTVQLFVGHYTRCLSGVIPQRFSIAIGASKVQERFAGNISTDAGTAVSSGPRTAIKTPQWHPAAPVRWGTPGMRPRCQDRQTAGPAPKRVRQAAIRNKEERFSTLLHHVTCQRLKDAFLN